MLGAKERRPDVRRTTERTAAEVREYGNPATPGHPDDIGNLDLTAMEDKVLDLIYASDVWIDPAWGESVPPRSVGVLGVKQQREEKWREEGAPKIRPPATGTLPEKNR